ncbi:SDR family NAD(P)-dependent oxidoreductase [Cryptosporangium sp. NPDC048952]|uniref:SDR family NAD(P)-dependent oxidoreductase n=1 Tax=Cryptosporangium sp. NPDC048952 TaxID=3363961 RepID=UPI00371D003F
MSRWGVGDIPSQAGRVAVVTGANAGIGFRTAEALVRSGASVVLACRDLRKGADAVARLGAGEVRELDLADLDSVRAFAAGLTGPIDLLINNAGIMHVPSRHTTAQGFELQFGTNHLGHFALTGLLLPQVTGRVVTVSSMLHKQGRVRQLDDPQSERAYSSTGAYSLSKLSNAWFTLELDRRLRAAGSSVLSVGAHPGFTDTNLVTTGPGADGANLWTWASAAVTRVVGQRDGLAVPFRRALARGKGAGREADTAERQDAGDHEDQAGTQAGDDVAVGVGGRGDHAGHHRDSGDQIAGHLQQPLTERPSERHEVHTDDQRDPGRDEVRRELSEQRRPDEDQGEFDRDDDVVAVPDRRIGHRRGAGRASHGEEDADDQHRRTDHHADEQQPDQPLRCLGGRPAEPHQAEETLDRRRDPAPAATLLRS